MTKKQKYINAFLDGYFSDKKVDFGIKYYSMLNNAIDIAENNWKIYRNYKNNNNMKQTRGGKREGSGRPKNENKAYSIQCHPSKIKELREYAKNISKINEK